MADPSPSLPPTPTADRTPYAPYAALALAAVAVAGLFILLLVVFGLSAVMSKQSIFYPPLLVLPAVAVVLAFAGRRQVLNSEGARDGLGLCNLAWWMAVGGGLGFAMYLAGIQFSVRAEAARGVNEWAKNLAEVDTGDPKNQAFFRTFVGTLEPDKQGNYKSNQPEEIWKTAKTQALGVRQSDVVQHANRNRGALTVEVGGLESWDQEPTGRVCKIAVTFRSPEGEFTGKFPMVGRTVDGVPRWSIGVNPAGNFTAGRFSRYGQRLRDIALTGNLYVYQSFVPSVMYFGHEKAALLDEYAQPAGTRIPFEGRAFARMAVAGTIGYLRPEPADYADRLNKVFQPADRDPARDAEQRKVFAQVWKAGRFGPPRRFLQSNPEAESLTAVQPDYIELKVPVEMQPPGNETASAIRGHIVLRLDDPTILAELNQLRAAAATESLQDYQPRVEPSGAVPWKVVRIESDMKLVQDRPPQQGPPGMGG